MKGDIIIHITNISGKERIECEVDGLSRNCPTEEIIQG